MQRLENRSKSPSGGSLAVGTGLTLASLILVPALSQSLGMGPSLTSALRILLMKAAAKI